MFPVDSVGLSMLPHAEAMTLVAQYHFTFFSPESNLDGDQDQSKLESSVAEILQVLKGQKPPSRPTTPFCAWGPKAKSKTAALRVPQGLDPQVVMQARAAGISEKALEELGQALRDQPAQLPPVDPQTIDPAVSSDEDEDDVDLGNGSGPPDPVGKGLGQLDKDCGRNVEGEQRKEVKRLEVHFGSGRIWLFKGGWRVFKTSKASHHSAKAHLHCARSPFAGGLGDGRPTTPRRPDIADFCEGVVGASFEDQQLPGHDQTCLALWASGTL